MPLPYHLAERIRNGIVSGRYAPGAPLREQALEAEYGCSRGPVREALRLLDQRGLVHHAPRYGFRVRLLDAGEVRQIYALRAVLERHAVEGLEGRVTETLLDRLRAVNEEMRGHAKAGDVDAYLAANLAFHALLREAAPNPTLGRTLHLVNEMAEPLRHALLRVSVRSSAAADQHDGIVALLSQDRVQEAALAMHEHVLQGLNGALRVVDMPSN